LGTVPRRPANEPAVEPSATKRRILDTARALFNERGLGRVGVRDIARELGMSPGNLGYHFATKDDLVAALVLELHERNEPVWDLELPPDFSMATLYALACASMRSTLDYRFILLSYADAVAASPSLQEIDARLAVRRRRRYAEMIAALDRNGHVDGRRIAPRLAVLAEQGEMIASGWLAASRFHPELRGDEAIIAHYAKLGCALLEPYCTPKGKRKLRRLLAGG
jgi:AcrR family transcriptional regulator